MLFIFLILPLTLALDCFVCNSEPGQDDSESCVDRIESCPDDVGSCSMVTYRSIPDEKFRIRKFCTSTGTEAHESLLFFPGAAICQNIQTANNKIQFMAISDPQRPQELPLMRAKRIRRAEPPAPPQAHLDSLLCVCSSPLCNGGTPEQVLDQSIRHDILRAPDHSAKKIFTDSIGEIA